MKRTISLLIALSLLALFCVPAFAADYTFVVDRTGKLPDVDELNEMAQRLYDETGFVFCYAAADLPTGEDCDAFLEEVYISGDVLPLAPAIFLVDGGDSVYSRSRNGGSAVLGDETFEELTNVYLQSDYYSDGARLYFEKAASLGLNVKDEAVSTTGAPVSSANKALRRMVDDAGLLTSNEADTLNDKLYEISANRDCDVVIVTVDGLGGKTATQFADDYFDYNGYGVGSDYSGILFLISMADRDWAISTCGYGITAFTDYGQEQIVSAIKPDLSDGEYYDAFNAFADYADDFLSKAESGDPVDVNNPIEIPEDNPLRELLLNPVGIVILLLIAFLLAGVPLKKLKDEINNVKFKSGASDYVRQGSLQILQSYDNFLYANTTQQRIQTESSSSSRSSGGSSTHSSSSGRSHGGSSGKF